MNSNLAPDIVAAIDCYNSYWNFAAFDKQFTMQGVDVKIITRNNNTRIVFPGSKSWMDWKRDIASIRQVQHPKFGLVGDGFVIGSDDIYTALQPQIPIGNDITLEGHSLGAARAVIQAAEFITNGYDPKRISLFLFGCPHPGGQQLLGIVKPVGLFHAWRNTFDGEIDPVTEVPPAEVGALPVPVQDISSKPVALDMWPLDMALHHIQAYLVSLLLKVSN